MFSCPRQSLCKLLWPDKKVIIMYIKQKLNRQFDIIEQGLRKAFAKKRSVADLTDLELQEAMVQHDCKEGRCEVCLEWRKRGLKLFA